MVPKQIWRKRRLKVAESKSKSGINYAPKRNVTRHRGLRHLSLFFFLECWRVLSFAAHHAERSEGMRLNLQPRGRLCRSGPDRIKGGAEQH